MTAWAGKPCAGCGGKKGRAYARKKFCGNCTRKQDKASKEAQWAARMFRLYGLTPEQYEALYHFQGDRCALCRRATGRSRRLAVDHDHATGEIRGLCCGTCNKILGHARDDAEYFYRSAAYLHFPPWTAMHTPLPEDEEAA